MLEDLHFIVNDSYDKLDNNEEWNEKQLIGILKEYGFTRKTV